MANLAKLKSALNLTKESSFRKAEAIVRSSTSREVNKVEDHKVTPETLKPWDAAGYFLKESNKLLDNKKAWHRRFFILKKSTLYWYETEKSQEFLGSVVLGSAAEVTKDKKDGKVCFVLHNGKRELVLSPAGLSDAETSQVTDEWIEDLKRSSKGDQPVQRSRTMTGRAADLLPAPVSGERPTHLKCLLITSNVGDLFESEKNSQVIDSWTQLMQKLIRQHDPHFVAFTMQEIGGKDSAFLQPLPYFYETFAEEILETGKEPYHHSGLIWNPDLKSPDFQAMASMFMAKRSVLDLVQVWDYRKNAFIPFSEMNPLQEFAHCDAATGGQVLSKRFSNTKSRKGYIGTKWKLGQRELKIVNVHLYHDDNNTVAVEKTPSTYAEKRQVAFLDLLEKNDIKDNEPAIISGDFNFRVDGQPLLQWMKEEFKDNILADANFLAMKEKKFVFKNTQQFFNDKSRWSKLLTFDQELHRINKAQSRTELHELPIAFPPTYCVDEDHDNPIPNTVLYSDKRIPSWCDRVIFTKAAEQTINMKHSQYQGLVGSLTGDHVPIYFTFETDV